MDTDELSERFGKSGGFGFALLAIGLLIVGRENRRAAIGASAVVFGSGLIAHGLVGSVLESMGMSYEDL